MTDRVRMKSKTVMNNALIESHAEGRPDPHTVTEGDEFSTSEVHAAELEALSYAERIKGEAAPASKAALRLMGAQVPSTETAIVSNRLAPKAKPVEPAKT